MKIEGLRIFQAMSPFTDYFGTVLDLDGPWTQALSDADSNNDMRLGDTNDPPSGLAVWEGSCEVVVSDEGSDDESCEYNFAGTWRAPTSEEFVRLAQGLTPLRGMPFHTLDKRISVDATFRIKREVDAFVTENRLPDDPAES